MSVADVQAVSNTYVSADTPITAVPLTISAVGFGNAVGGIVYWLSASDLLTSVTDDQGNTYTIVDKRLNIQGNGFSAASFYLGNITNAPTVITANLSGAGAGNRGIAIREASGAAAASPLDKNVSNDQGGPGTGTDAVTSTAQTTTTNGQYIFGGVCDSFDWHVDGWWNAGTNFLARNGAGSAAKYPISTEYRIQAAQGSIAATFTQVSAGGSDPATFLLTFKAAAGGGAAQVPYQPNYQMAPVMAQ